ncbi:hypothetical protein BVY11_09695 [Pseudomonas amygdali pv. morsprunorum]|nr:hypothetical protein BVY12_26025 [Pseudomonas amygdali pv. morsprunorum]PPS32150.1 hypothetical protein BVY11_09695 [Pseudomonas amygdali pv. morsprunorum]
MFKFHEVWTTVDENKMVIYFCFEDLSSNQFCVQSMEGYGLPLTTYRNIDARKQAIELFIEESPSDRCVWGTSLKDAIEKFEILMSS